MAFVVDDFHDLVRLLEEHPEWRAQLRRLVLSEELLALPDLMRTLTARVDALTEAQQRTEERLDRLTARVDALTEAQQRTEERLHTLTEAQQQMTVALTQLTKRVERMDGQLTEMRGDWLEWRYERRAGAYFGTLLRRVHVLEPEELDTLLDGSEERGVLSEAEAEDVRWADLVLRGRRRDSGEPSYAVAEVSAGIGIDDVWRAQRRAERLSRVSPTLALVAGEWINAEAAEAATRLGVHVVAQRERRAGEGAEERAS